jgi:hypothetical protein
MSDPNPPGGPPGQPPGGAPGEGPPLTPGAARRRLGTELRLLREEADLTAAEAGEAIERSAATISRFESARYVPRLVEIDALLNHYQTLIPGRVTPEDRERILSLVPECRKKQWFDPFKDRATGDMMPAHLFRLVEYETDASEIRTYESDLVPGVLQTREYALAVARIFYPSREPVEHDRFAEFRVTRWKMLRQRAGHTRMSLIVNEVALRRPLGGRTVFREQLEALAGIIDDQDSGADVNILPLTIATPAALGGPFVVFSFPADDDGDLVYLESRSGGNYLAGLDDIVRFNAYFESLLAIALSRQDSAALIRTIIQELGS